QEEEFENIKKKIEKENSVTKLEVDIKEEIDFKTKYIDQKKKNELHIIRDQKIKSLKGAIDFLRIKEEIENESLLSNLLDRNLFDDLIRTNSFLVENQRQLLQTTRKKQLQLLVNNYYNTLKKEIEISKDLEQLNDSEYFDERIGEVREEYLNSNNSKEKLHILRRSRIDRLLESEEDQRYNLIRDIINNTENIKEISDLSEIFTDIKVLNQTLLTGNCDKSELERERKTQYNNGLYDIINRIKELKEKENTPKCLLEDDDIPTRNLDKAEQIRDASGSFDKQINFIITQYKKHYLIKDKNSLLEVFYLNWVLGKDEKYLLNKKFTKKKINEVNNLVKDINNYLYEEPRKKAIMNQERLEKNKKFKKLRRYPILYLPAEFSWDNPLCVDQEKIDIIKSVDLVIIEYKKSLANILKITIENINIIQDSLNQLGLSYETKHDKKNFLNLITKVLVNRKNVEEINDNNIKEVFRSFEILY
ncbi:13989_t:CDS:2, partial [Racocetra persica]